MTEERQVEYASYPSLRGRVVLVTGGASGIGERIVEQFAHQGARVVFLDIQKDAGMQLAKKISAGWRFQSPTFCSAISPTPTPCGNA